MLENDPFADGPDSSWAASYQAFPEPIATQAGDRIAVTLRHRDLILTLDAARAADA